MRRPNAFAHIPEEFLRQIWKEGRFTSANLRTADGRPVSIVSPGRANDDGGPDFRDAAIRIGSIVYRGDVELHVEARAWGRHRHDRDPHYNAVILHVVLAAGDSPSVTASRRTLPLLVLHPHLDPETERAWIASFGDHTDAHVRAMRCARSSRSVSPALVERWLARLAAERCEGKVQRLEERLKQLVDEERGTVREPYPRYYGDPSEIPHPHPGYRSRDFSSRKLWDQLLFEGVMEGMGYAKNRSPFLALARSFRIALLRQYALEDSHTMMAILFGAAGLLPAAKSIKEKESRTYVRLLRNRWREVRPALRLPLLHEGDWLFFRLRPANFPTARLATICFLLPALFHESMLRTLVRRLRQREAPRMILRGLRGAFSFAPDGFWQHHLHFTGFSSAGGLRLGRDRRDAILMNSVLPFFMLYARLFRDREIRDRARQVAAIMPRSHDNGITRLVEQTLFRGRGRLRSAWAQQGALQLHQSYCRVDGCLHCEVGKVLFR